MAEGKYNWGIWLPESRQWAQLPPRLRKPTPWNCDLIPALVGEMQQLESEGVACELKKITPRQLEAMKLDSRAEGQ